MKFKLGDVVQIVGRSRWQWATGIITGIEDDITHIILDSGSRISTPVKLEKLMSVEDTVYKKHWEFL